MIKLLDIALLLYGIFWLYCPPAWSEEGKKVFESKAGFANAWSPPLTAQELEMFEPIYKGDKTFQNLRFSGKNSLRGLKCNGPVLFSILSLNGNILSSYEDKKNWPICHFREWAMTSGVWTKEMKPELVGIVDKKISDAPFGIRTEPAKVNFSLFEKAGLKNVKLYTGGDLSMIIREIFKWNGITVQAGASVYFGGGEDGTPNYVQLTPYDKKRTVKVESAECSEVHKYTAPYIACVLAKDLKLKTTTVPIGSIVLYSIPNKIVNPEPVYALKLTEDVTFKGEVFKKGTSIQIQKGQVSIGYPLDDEYEI